MYYLLSFKTIDKSIITYKDVLLSISRKQFIEINVEEDKEILFQLIQDFDFSFKMNKNEKVFLKLIYCNDKELLIKDKLNKYGLMLVHEYVTNFNENNIEIINTALTDYDRNIKVICEKKIEYNNFLEDYNKYSSKDYLLYDFDMTCKHYYENLIYETLNDKLPNELILIIIKFLKFDINMSFNVYFSGKFNKQDSLYVTLPMFKLFENKYNEIKNMLV